jgi:ribosomal protein S18 acetylase RimI-like enzyme
MTHPIELTLNRATAAEGADHLSQSDESFVPPLSQRVDISDYARKITSHAERFEAWADGVLVGLVAAYCNDTSPGAAYITSVSVHPGYRNQGLASRLLGACVDFAKSRRIERVSLHVDRENHAAVDLYTAAGFAIMSQRGRAIEMTLDTRKDTQRSNPS